MRWPLRLKDQVGDARRRRHSPGFGAARTAQDRCPRRSWRRTPQLARAVFSTPSICTCRAAVFAGAGFDGYGGRSAQPSENEAGPDRSDHCDVPPEPRATLTKAAGCCWEALSWHAWADRRSVLALADTATRHHRRGRTEPARRAHELTLAPTQFGDSDLRVPRRGRSRLGVATGVRKALRLSTKLPCLDAADHARAGGAAMLRALELHREVGNRPGRGIALGQLANVPADLIGSGRPSTN